MPDTYQAPTLRWATAAERRRWSDLLWTTIQGVRKGQGAGQTEAQLEFIAREILPPLKPNGDPDNG